MTYSEYLHSVLDIPHPVEQCFKINKILWPFLRTPCKQYGIL